MIRRPSSFAVRVAVAEPCIYGIHHKAKSWVVGMAAPAPACHCVVPFVPWYYPTRKSFCPYQDPAPVEPSDYRRQGERGSAVTKRTSPTSSLSNWPASRLIAGALAIIIFAIDAFTPLDIAIAVLYVIVVLMAANFLRRRGVILFGLACAGLTLLSFILERGYWGHKRFTREDSRKPHHNRASPPYSL